MASLVLLLGGLLEAQVGHHIGLDDAGVDGLRALGLGVVAPHQEGRLDEQVEGDVLTQVVGGALSDLFGETIW